MPVESLQCLSWVVVTSLEPLSCCKELQALDSSCSNHGRAKVVRNDIKWCSVAAVSDLAEELLVHLRFVRLHCTAHMCALSSRGTLMQHVAMHDLQPA